MAALKEFVLGILLLSERKPARTELQDRMLKKMPGWGRGSSIGTLKTIGWGGGVAASLHPLSQRLYGPELWEGSLIEIFM